jgi:hypothetical protein
MNNSEMISFLLVIQRIENKLTTKNVFKGIVEITFIKESNNERYR